MKKAQAFKYESERRTTKPEAPPADRAEENETHRAKKASVVREETEGDARPSRKSTRRSKHRARGDVEIGHAAENRRSAPSTRAAQARVKKTRTRGSTR